MTFLGRFRLTVAPCFMALALALRCVAQEPTPAITLPVEPTKPGSAGNTIQEAHVPPAFIFFPPLAPPLDSPVSRVIPASLGGPTPPPELASYVNEFFYAPLGTRLVKRELSGGLRRRLEAYRTARDDLRREVLTELDHLRPADPGTRRNALETLARQQAARLAELEQGAEALRDDLVDGFYGWFSQREWHLGEAGPVSDSPAEVMAVLRAYASYRPGLLPVQRGLLREISWETELARENADASAAAQPYFFFSPEMTRVQLTDELPASLAARIAEYQTKKSALKKELYDAVYEQEKASFVRGNTLKEVAAGQRVQLAALEKLAEQIRRDLAVLPNPVRTTAPSPLPPVLTERVNALVRRRGALLLEAQAKIQEIDRTIDLPVAPFKLIYEFGPTGLTFDVARTTQSRGVGAKEVARKMEDIARAMAVVAANYGRGLAEIANETNLLREAIATTLVYASDPPADVALAAAMRYASAQENVGAYRDYRTAVFEPGLSPEQRRLLLGHALEELHLPLPPGELQPTFRNR